MGVVAGRVIVVGVVVGMCCFSVPLLSSVVQGRQRHASGVHGIPVRLCDTVGLY